VQRSGRWGVGELNDRSGDPAPGVRAIVIAGGRELVSAQVALLERFAAVALQHQRRGPPDVDFGYYRARLSPIRERCLAPKFIVSGCLSMMRVRRRPGFASAARRCQRRVRQWVFWKITARRALQQIEAVLALVFEATENFGVWLRAGWIDVNPKEQRAKRAAFQFQNAPRGVTDGLKLAKLGPLLDFVIASRWASRWQRVKNGPHRRLLQFCCRTAILETASELGGTTMAQAIDGDATFVTALATSVLAIVAVLALVIASWQIRVTRKVTAMSIW
jgi:hypothetical protein